ncbi:MAG TPA: hypothetical protein VLB11_04390 [Methyloceanibacter sp.]|nr:hypothetical protein [Methyloceanibacter sp.]
MRHVAMLAAILTGSAILLGSSGQAGAGPAVVASPAASQSFTEKAGWRRYCRRYGCGPDVVYPGAVVVPEAEAEFDAEAEIESDAPAVIVLPPPRPLSCGQYRYWNGVRCVDARYTDPYLGPR